MQEVHLFAGWESFYVIIGSSAAALTGLQFVVMALVADSERPGGPQEVAAFGSPTVVHFCSALLISALFTAPWHAVANAGRAASLLGLGGLIYTVIVLRRALRQSGYQPVFEDWLWHTILPGAAYLALLVSGLTLSEETGSATFFVGAAALLLVFIGIHNAWDTVTYIALYQKSASAPPNPPRAIPPTFPPAPPAQETRVPQPEPGAEG
jgi:hypothetical protein